MDTEVEEVRQVQTSCVWQPVLLIVPKRIDCGVCHAKAVFVVLDDPQCPADDKLDYGYQAWCQDCWQRETEG